VFDIILITLSLLSSFIQIITFLYYYPAKRHPELPQELLLGHAELLSLLLFMYAGAEIYSVSIFVEPHCGHGMRFSSFSAIVALIFDVASQSIQRKS